jgi:molybdate transport system ATP-binding protein
MTLDGGHRAPLVALSDVTLRVRDRKLLRHTNWVIDRHQQWVIIGPNGAGKSTLARALTGEVPVVQGTITFDAELGKADCIGYISFEVHRRVMAREEQKDEARYFSGRINEITTARTLAFAGLAAGDETAQAALDLAHQLGISHLLDRGLRWLSTGEIRKVLILRELIRAPRLLILDEPFDGLDRASRRQLGRLINELMNGNRQVILITHRSEEILPNISHVLVVDNGQVVWQGKRHEVLACSSPVVRSSETSAPAGVIPSVRPEHALIPETLVAMKNVTVAYGDTVVFKNISWTMRAGEHWAIAGPNGSGKSTLLSLVAGDNPQAYANEIYLFGHRRGSGESIWDITHHIGIISSEFQIRYRKSILARDVVLSGFFDSIGLFRQGTAEQQNSVDKWLHMLKVAHLADRPFNQLSQGEQRLVLLARAMVKMPLLLILDEPCQGLDALNRHAVLDIVDRIGRHSSAHILFVTHYADEIPVCISHRLRLEKSPDGYSSAIIERL